MNVYRFWGWLKDLFHHDYEDYMSEVWMKEYGRHL
jgi:hypothetical protein